MYTITPPPAPITIHDHIDRVASITGRDLRAFKHGTLADLDSVVMAEYLFANGARGRDAYHLVVELGMDMATLTDEDMLTILELTAP